MKFVMIAISIYTHIVISYVPEIFHHNNLIYNIFG